MNLVSYLDVLLQMSKSKLCVTTFLICKTNSWGYHQQTFVITLINKIKNLGGKDWCQKFMEACTFLQESEYTSTARANGFNKEAVNKFYDLLEICINKYHIKNENIYNVDETSVKVNPKSTLIIAKKV